MAGSVNKVILVGNLGRDPEIAVMRPPDLLRLVLNFFGILDAWQSPGAVGWDGATLMNGSALSNQRLGQIVAVRVGLVLRSALIEKEVQPGVPVAPANLTLFGDLPAANQITVDLNAAGENRESAACASRTCAA